ncbi:ABC transporter ATP-binding protein [Wukongibacter sp. M2B1]|uniref:ABC transporter ATP-binding protein n=1 Tax=Wukongibacter sp. M2B1 TaxID=3088895 RepID=UPI003D79F66B
MIFNVKDGYFYYNDIPILKDVRFSVKDGELMTILGPNGVGKTTLVKCMLGFLEWEKGDTFIDGDFIKSYSRNQLWKRIGYVPQMKTLPFSYTAESLVLMGRNPYINFFSRPKKEDYYHVDRIFEAFRLGHLKKKQINRLSGGEIQMILIARALVSEPELLILDEPELNLDLANQVKIFEILAELVKSKGIGCIINTHHPMNAIRYGQKSLLLMKNFKYIYGDTKDILNRRNLSKTFELSKDWFDFKIS